MELITLLGNHVICPLLKTSLQVKKLISTKTHNFDIRRNKSPKCFPKNI
jgi:hypothetical protein